MRRKILSLLLCLLAGSLVAQTVTQYSTYVGLIQRLFDGFVTIETVLSKGNHGIGTTDQLHGELLILDGAAYRVNFEGKVELVGKEETTPYVTLAQVDKKDALQVTLPAGTTVADLDDKLLALTEGKFQKNFPYAIRLEGDFSAARMRSIPKLQRPYITMTEVVANQSLFNFENHPFTIIGFWNPSYAEAFNPPKWHIHGLDAAKKAGGHVLAFTTGKDVKVYLWKMTQMDIRMPDSKDFADANFDQDFNDAVQKINRDQVNSPRAGLSWQGPQIPCDG
ncbi:MAG: acetolactate decarboxylase [Bdellovibrionaceae bacterium]|nr:acetolactate decarboxylase [Pseudobdellovibrionaceae bacterium]